MSIEDLDNFEIQYIDFYSEIPIVNQPDNADERHDYIDAINNEITDLHDSTESTTGSSLSDQQVSQLAQDQYNEAGVNHSQATSRQDITLFSENL